jgi:putative aldouronate transport system substrate-binding protein
LKHAMKTVTFFSIAAMLAITGCSDNKTGKSSAVSPSTTNEAAKEKPVLKIMTPVSPIAPPNPNDKLIFKRLEEKTGIHIDWIAHPEDVFADKRNLALSTGDLPDAIFNAGLSDFDLLRYSKDGTIIPLESYIDKMPNFKKVLEQAPQYKGMMTAPDGHIYAFPWIEELGQGKESIHAVNNIPWINTAWLKKLGLEMPKTTEELKNVLIAFKTKDPNGNGKADEIPLSIINDDGGSEDFSFLLGSFGDGFNWNLTLVDNNGKVNNAVLGKGYKEGMKYFQSLYKEGLIDEEFITQDWPKFIAKGKEDRYGLYFTWDKANVTGMDSPFEPMPALAGPDGTKNVARANGMGFDRGRIVITADNKNIETTIKWIDAMYDPTQSVQNNWGTYGDTTQPNIFEYDETQKMLKHSPLKGVAPGELRGKTSVGGPLAILDSYYGKVTTKPDDAAWRLDILKKVYVPDMKANNMYPNVFFSIEDAERLAQIEADMMPYITRKRTEWMQGANVDQEWDGFIKELDRLGMKDWLKIKQAGYDRSKK